MSKIIHIPNGTEEITAVTLTTILREKGVIGTETAVADIIICQKQESFHVQ
jgi:hypothetical protein